MHTALASHRHSTICMGVVAAAMANLAFRASDPFHCMCGRTLYTFHSICGCCFFSHSQWKDEQRLWRRFLLNLRIRQQGSRCPTWGVALGFHTLHRWLNLGLGLVGFSGKASVVVRGGKHPCDFIITPAQGQNKPTKTGALPSGVRKIYFCWAFIPRQRRQSRRVSRISITRKPERNFDTNNSTHTHTHKQYVYIIYTHNL